VVYGQAFVICVDRAEFFRVVETDFSVAPAALGGGERGLCLSRRCLLLFGGETLQL
jgi:hypothetical protein